MYILEFYYEHIIKHDLINKFKYSNIKNIAKLKKIILNFGCNNSKFKSIASAFLFLELLSNNSVNITKTKKSNLVLKIRKGTPIGCSVTLTRTKMYKFLFKFLIEILPVLKNFKGIPYVLKKNSYNSFSFYIKDLVLLKEFNTHFHLFNNLPPLNVTIITNTKNEQELIYLLQSFKIPLILKTKKCNSNSIGRV